MSWLPYEIFATHKDFGGRWVGHPVLNRFGLHPARIALSDLCLGVRRRQVAALGTGATLGDLHRDGVLVVRDLLLADELAALRAEVVAHMRALAAAHPPAPPAGRGFGDKEPFPGGFDRYDGGTLNRYGAIDAATTPLTARAIRNDRLAAICRAASGFRHSPHRFWIYQTVHGDESDNPDIQKALHRDTFHSTVKLWLFLDDVRDEHGPFMYVPGSHRMTSPRYRWEYERAVAASAPGSRRTGGAFRIDTAALAPLGLPAPRTYPVAANTLIVADVRGFHCRGPAQPGARRLCLYANLRKNPFAPIPY
jgi:hypothetical protein